MYKPGSLRTTPATLVDWARNDAYQESFLIAPDAGLDATRGRNADQGLPDIAVSASQGKFLKLTAQSIGAKRIIEVGTLGGYSTIWLAQAVGEEGEVISFELSEKYAELARNNIANAGFAKTTRVVVGPAIDGLKALRSEPPFDLVFIDADKQSSLEYFIEAKRLVRPGGIIIIDNVVRYGFVSKPEYEDDVVEGVRKLLRALQEDKEVDATTISTVGDKGFDGFLYARKK